MRSNTSAEDGGISATSLTLRGYLRGILVAAMLGVFSGCATHSNDLYHWGSYESVIYTMYKTPGKATPEMQIERLQRDIEQAQARGLTPAPGIFAHLGVMHAAMGNMSKAEAAFMEEKLRFPESTVLVDGMMSRAMRSQ